MTNLNHELLQNLVRRNADNKTELIIRTLRPLALKHNWSLEQLGELACVVVGIVHESEMELSETVDELLRDLINNGSRA